MDIKEGLSSKKLVVNVKQGMKLESDECNTSTNCNPKAKISLPGIRRQKNGRYGVELTDPIRHKRVWVGTFDTVEEASQAYFSKKSEFENEKLRQQGNKKSKRIRKTIGIVEVHKRGKYNSEKSEELVNVKQENANVNREIFQTESAGGSEIDVPISNSSNGGTEKRIDLHEIGAVEEAFRIAKEGSRVFNLGLMANVCGTKSSDDCNNITTSCNPEVKVSLIGTRKQKNGRYAAVITDPFMHKRVRLGTFDTVEEASQAYFSKKSEFEKLSQQGNKQNILKKKNCDQIQQLESSSVVAFLDTTASESGRAKRIDSQKKKTHLIGAHKSTRKGRYQSEIKNPITKKRIWLGTFGSAEEASHAYQSKKLEFQKLVEEKKKQCTYKQLKSEKLVNLKQGHENVKCEPESSPDIDIPFSNSSNGGTIQSIDPDKIGNQSKKFDLELESNMPIDSSAGEKQGQEDDEDSWKGEWVQLPGDDRAVMFSLKLGLPIIDNYGSLLGEFSTLDDLSICKTEEGNNYISHSI